MKMAFTGPSVVPFDILKGRLKARVVPSMLTPPQSVIRRSQSAGFVTSRGGRFRWGGRCRQTRTRCRAPIAAPTGMQAGNHACSLGINSQIAGSLPGRPGRDVHRMEASEMRPRRAGAVGLRRSSAKRGPAAEGDRTCSLRRGPTRQFLRVTGRCGGKSGRH